MPSSRDDAQALLAALIPFAEKTLRKYRAFHPFGGHVDAEGDVVWDAVHEAREMPAPADIIDMLVQLHRQQAWAGSSRACATVYDILTVPPGETAKRDAIAAAIEHADGYSVVVTFPYRFATDGELLLEDSFAEARDNQIFTVARA